VEVLRTWYNAEQGMDAAICLGVRSLYPARQSGQLQIQYKKTFTALSEMSLEKSTYTILQFRVVVSGKIMQSKRNGKKQTYT
jgi:hypothetical protein